MTVKKIYDFIFLIFFEFKKFTNNINCDKFYSLDVKIMGTDNLILLIAPSTY